MAIAGLVLGICAAVAAAVSAWFARSAAKSAEKTADAAVSSVNIEKERRHAELQPDFEVVCEREHRGNEQWTLRLKLVGPVELGHLDEVAVRIRDKSAHQLKSPADSERIWGPLRFVPGTGPYTTSKQGTGRADQFGRETRVVRKMPIGEALVYSLEPSPPALSWQRDQWQQEVGSLLRLEMEARRDEHKPWLLFKEIDLGAEWSNPAP
ncbi:MAG: hypothetical protein M0010_06960 [Actinomycetota bacterium]|jgi:hypothetical protein|nr:hypothetical protein [Actinomycetota bacterium]